MFVSAYTPDDKEHGLHLMQHGDGVKDVAFEVEDLNAIFNLAVSRGAEVVRDIWEENDAHGFVRFATIKTVSLYDRNAIKYMYENIPQVYHDIHNNIPLHNTIYQDIT